MIVGHVTSGFESHPWYLEIFACMPKLYSPSNYLKVCTWPIEIRVFFLLDIFNKCLYNVVLGDVQ